MVNSSTSTVPEEEITKDMYDGLSESDKQKELEQLEQFENELKTDIRDPKGITHKILFSTTKDIIREWANNLKKRHYLGGYDKPLETISSYIKKQIGKIPRDLDSKEISYRYVDEVLDSEFKEQKYNHNKGVEKHLLNASVRKLIEEEQFLLDTLKSLQTFFKGMASITGTLASHLENPQINNDILEYFDQYYKIAALREPIEFMMGEGSILHQIDDEQNIRESATIYQLAIAKAMEAILSYRQMAHFFAVSPRQNQRIRNRLDEWPAKDANTVIRKNILSFCCQGCGLNVITGKKYSKNGEVIDEIKLSHTTYPIPKKFQGQPLSPIQIAMEVSKEIVKK